MPAIERLEPRKALRQARGGKECASWAASKTQVVIAVAAAMLFSDEPQRMVSRPIKSPGSSTLTTWRSPEGSTLAQSAQPEKRVMRRGSRAPWPIIVSPAEVARGPTLNLFMNASSGAEKSSKAERVRSGQVAHQGAARFAAAERCSCMASSKRGAGACQRTRAATRAALGRATYAR